MSTEHIGYAYGNHEIHRYDSAITLQEMSEKSSKLMIFR